MRTHGTVQEWNDERGFGFIAPASGGEKLFVHISAFPRGERPRVNEVISFEIEAGPNGKSRAVRVKRPGQRSESDRTAGSRRAGRPARSWPRVPAILIIVAVVAYVHWRQAPPEPSPTMAPSTAAPDKNGVRFNFSVRLTTNPASAGFVLALFALSSDSRRI